jgi:uncharacterized protein YfaT (DUF1175 family)
LPSKVQEEANQNMFELVLQKASMETIEQSLKDEMIGDISFYAHTLKHGKLLESWIEKGVVYKPGEESKVITKLVAK